MLSGNAFCIQQLSSSVLIPWTIKSDQHCVLKQHRMSVLMSLSTCGLSSSNLRVCLCFYLRALEKQVMVPHMRVLATGVGTEGKVAPENRSLTRDSRKVLHSVGPPSTVSEHTCARGCCYFYQRHIFCQVKNYTSSVNLTFSVFLTNFITIQQLPACRLDAENGFRKLHRPECIDAADQRLSAKVCLQNKSTL